ncbi:hypothetical protein RB200_05135 [Streptomyces sp. PmtG]
MYQKAIESQIAQHPLKTVRVACNLSQIEYAKRVAKALEELGYGRRMVKNHYQILRWESGTRPAPEAQRAIAHIHQVPEEAIERAWLATVAVPGHS